MQTSQEHQLFSHILSPELVSDPYNFVMFAFPWGQKHTPLENYKGPRQWQVEVLTEVRDHYLKQLRNEVLGDPFEVFRMAVASGRGIGKSALVSWLTLWFLSTRLGSTVIVAANSESQLKQVTWGEIGKWLAMSLNKHWFELSATMIRPSDHLTKVMAQRKINPTYHYAHGKLWSEENPDAFAGVHSDVGMMVIFDEASGIPPPIWNVSEGYFTEPHPNRFWFAFSNPRRNTGSFFECFNGARDFWKTKHIDSRSVEGTDGLVYQRIIQQYGEDSDVARVEVKGEFPRQGDQQFISREVITQATTRELQDDPHAPLIMGVDVARFGDDSSVIRMRQGRNARTFPVTRLKNLDNMQLAYKCAELIDKWKPDSVAIDAGNGTGVIDRLREMGYRVNEIWFGSKSEEPEWANRRTLMWARMREWLNGGCIDDNELLKTDLAGPEYRFAKGGDAIILEAKEEMKRRGLHSPDDGDALALTFAVRAARTDIPAGKRGRKPRVADVDYDIL